MRTCCSFLPFFANPFSGHHNLTILEHTPMIIPQTHLDVRSLLTTLPRLTLFHRLSAEGKRRQCLIDHLQVGALLYMCECGPFHFSTPMYYRR